ncbi:helicase-related protein, partial [Haloferax profundi]|uniref:helicase-related protein n=1 Tax=Haloferax profundi TaxID=1544718 RepID=UPI000AC3029E
ETRDEERDTLTSVVMSGETGFDVVRDVLERLESDDPENPVDIVNATSMISHGVDVDTLNFISFFGMPRQTAEYIQAYSRVGRHVTGTVFDLFNPVHVRDRSHYTRFDRYHDFQDLLVEATPLERWAEFAVSCTMPGIFAAILLQYYDEQLESSVGRVYLYDSFREAQRAGDLDKDELLEFVKRSYCVTSDQRPEWAEDRTVDLYERKVEKEFDDIWERCMSGHPKDGFQGWIGSMIKRSEDDRGPMRSLRDIDEQLPIDVDTGTAQVLNMFDRRQ